MTLARKLFTLLFFTALCGLLPAAPAQKKRVAVLDFDFGTIQNWWGGHWDIGKGVASLIVTQLVRDGSYVVVERKALEAVLAEQNFSSSERADPATAARLGKILGVDAIILGTITQFGTETRDVNVGGAGGRLGGFGGGRVGTSRGKAKVAVDARVIDVDTGEILAVGAGIGESSRSGLLLAGFGGGRGGFGGGGIDMRSRDFRDSIIGEATYESVEKLSLELIDARPRIRAREVEVRGLVAHVSGTSLILNVGSGVGVEVGARLNVLRVTQTVTDPATGRVLRELTEPVGQIQVTEVDDRSSVGVVVSGSGFRVGDVVRSP